MSTNEKPSPRLPAPYRVLTDAEYDTAYARLTSAAQRHGSRLTAPAAHDALVATLAAAGVFLPAPEPDPDTCPARFLPYDGEDFGADMHGEWQQCADEPGHDGDSHDSGEIGWSDGAPGALPATAGGEA
ncbi:hypothetical protein [Streptomyces sp. NPDC002067]